MIEGTFYVKAAACIGAAIVMGVGSIGPALGQGFIGMKACENIGKYPQSAKDIKTLMLLAMTVTETVAIYCFVIALLLIVTMR
ncbi:MAG: ATP synthase F0, C subunit [candidate division TM6 bacterium GW2011_GWF2_30_66]|jgi:F-type H+-transporting ATPase subunit c|nr:MAG: ATP synthase F0, C subunit [candidate division TM6 bacterium GW2011_GWF2_30_66]